MKHSTLLAVLLTAGAVSAPMVSHAQDPNAAFSQIQTLTQAGKHAEALELSDKMVKMLSDPRSRVVKQFNYMLPYFLWQNGGILQTLGEYEKASAIYKEIATNADFKKAAMIKAAKENPGKSLDYTPFFTSSVFQVAYCLFNQAAGTEKVEGDPKIFPEAIKELEKYVKLYNGGRVNAMEKKQDLGPKATFLLLQAYLLQPTPDFAKAEECFDQTKKSKAALPDDMVMNALATIVKVVEKNPEYIAWIDKIVNASRDSYDLGVLRGAKFGDKFLNHAIKAGTVSSDSLKAGDAESAMAGARSAMSLYSLVPDVTVVENAYTEQLKCIEDSSLAAVPDQGIGIAYSPSVQKKVLEFYQGLDTNHQRLDAMSLLGSSAVVIAFGSNRLGKAAYQLISDRYPDLAVRDKEGKLSSMREKNMFQLSQLARLTGDEAYAVSLEKQLEAAGGAEGNSKNTLLVNKMGRFIKSGDWEDVISAADEVIEAFANDPTNDNYVTAKFCKIAAWFKLNQFDAVVTAGEELLKSGALKGAMAEKYEPQCIFFVLDSCNKMGIADRKKYDRAMELVDLYLEKYPSADLEVNTLIPNVCYTAIDTLLKRRGHGVEADNEADLARALVLCNMIAENWPTHALYPVSQMLAGNILIHGADETKKPDGIKLLEDSYRAAIALDAGIDRRTASNALFWLLSYSPEVEMPGEKPEAAAKRIAAYSDDFWTKVDQAGDKYCFPIARLNLKDAIDAKDEKAFDAASDKILTLVARESANNVKTGIVNEDVQAVFFDYLDKYFKTMASFGKDMSKDEKLAFIDAIEGVDKADKFTNAILDFCKLDVMSDALAAETDASKRSLLDAAISKGFRDMMNTYKPEELSNYLCVQVGNALIDYVAAMPESRMDELKQAIAYFDKAYNDKELDQRTPAALGKANALAISTSAADRAAAAELYNSLVALEDYDVMPEALAGLTKIHMAAGEYDKVIEVGNQFLKTRAASNSRLDMLMMMGQAYALGGDDIKALATYMNLYNQNRGKIGYSAPACVAIMDVMWNRNKPLTGSHMEGNYKPSDRWTAWSTGQAYISWIEKAGIEAKMSSTERDKYRVLRTAVEKYAADSAVQAEDKAKRDFERKVNAG